MLQIFKAGILITSEIMVFHFKSVQQMHLKTTMKHSVHCAIRETFSVITIILQERAKTKQSPKSSAKGFELQR